MRVFSVEKKHLKSDVKTLFYLNLITSISGLSSEILCIFLAQETSKLPNVKVGRLKRIMQHTAWLCVLDFFFIPPTLTLFLVALQPLELQGCIVSYLKGPNNDQLGLAPFDQGGSCSIQAFFPFMCFGPFLSTSGGALHSSDTTCRLKKRYQPNHCLSSWFITGEQKLC